MFQDVFNIQIYSSQIMQLLLKLKFILLRAV